MNDCTVDKYQSRDSTKEVPNTKDKYQRTANKYQSRDKKFECKIHWTICKLGKYNYTS